MLDRGMISLEEAIDRIADKSSLKREEIAFIFCDAKAEHMVEASHLKNEPWDRTLKEKGVFKKIDYILALDSDLTSILPDKAEERVEERQEMYRIFGAD